MRLASLVGGKTTWLAAVVLVLLPALAWLQYDWVNQLASADRDRRARTLRAAGWQFTSAVDAELSRVGGSLQLDGAMVERQDWDAYALRYDAALASGATASLVRSVWYVEQRPADTGQEAQFRLHQWRPELRQFESTPWPADLSTVHAQMTRFSEAARNRPRGPRERIAATTALGDERTLVMPIIRGFLPRTAEGERPGLMPDVQMRGFTVIGLALDTLTSERLPALVAEHFPESADYRVAVVAREGGRVIFESEPGAADLTASAPDFTNTFFQPRVGPMMVFTRTIGDGGPAEGHVETPAPTPPATNDAEVPAGDTFVSVVEVRGRDNDRTVRARTMSHGAGYWTLRVKHRAGSLEAAVAASRRRNLTLSGSVLALLGVAVALIAVSARRAQALARQQMEFVAAVSHELRTPVAVINSAAGNLADGVVGDPARVKRYGATIQTEARRLGETVERVLQLAGLGSGRPVPMSPVSAAEIVRDALQQSSLDATRAGVDVQVAVAPELPGLMGDPGSLQSAVQNLVGNAVKYAGHDRWVRVRVTRHGTTAKPEVHIAVEDHGAGLDADEQRRIFEPFFRGKRAVADQVQGSGLGLSLVKRIVEAHAGRVELVSAPGVGSTFTICLPAVAQVSGVPDAVPVDHSGARPAATQS